MVLTTVLKYQHHHQGPTETRVVVLDELINKDTINHDQEFIQKNNPFNHSEFVTVEPLTCLKHGNRLFKLEEI